MSGRRTVRLERGELLMAVDNSTMWIDLDQGWGLRSRYRYDHHGALGDQCQLRGCRGHD